MAETYPNLFSEEFIRSLDSSVNIGRIYGPSVGTSDFVQKLRNYLEIE